MRGGNTLKTIILSGVHGVGKSFFLSKMENDIQDYKIYSASQLIGKYCSASDAGYKRVSNVDSNQSTLIKAIREEQKHNVNDMIIDGHICLFNKQGVIERIPTYFFTETKISGIILLQDKVEIISDRIKKRDNREIKPDVIEKMQNEEQQYAVELQNMYGIKYAIISHECTEEQFKELLKKWGDKYGE